MAKLQIFEDISEETLARVSAFCSDLPEKEKVDLEITSYGGGIYEAVALIQKIQETQSRGVSWTSKIYGLAASSAADIALCCDRVEMASTSVMLIHSAWNSSGKEDPGIHLANEAQLSIIRKRVPDYTEKDLQTDHWYKANEAKELGLCDFIFDSEVNSTQAKLSAKYLAKHTDIGGIFMSEIDEKKPVEQAEEIVEEKKEEVMEEKKEEDAPSIEDILERIGERLDDLEARLAAIEEHKAECGERKENARMKAVYEKICAVSRPAEKPEAVVVKSDPKAELEAYKAKYGDISRFINID